MKSSRTRSFHIDIATPPSLLLSSDLRVSISLSETAFLTSALFASCTFFVEFLVFACSSFDSVSSRELIQVVIITTGLANMPSATPEKGDKGTLATTRLIFYKSLSAFYNLALVG